MINLDVMAYGILLMVLKAESPYKTGNLSTHGIRIVSNTDTGHIKIGGETYEEADYAIYTNEPWLSPKWNGKKNPNEGWIDRAIQRAIPLIKDVYQNKLTEADVQQIMDDLQLEYIKKVREKNPKGMH